jgi:hypothetical protein
MKDKLSTAEELLNAMDFNCYLYATNFETTQEERKIGEKIHRIATYPYSIPVSFAILVSQEARICYSLMKDYQNPVGIQGNFEKGKQKLFEFLDRVQEENIFDNKELLERLITHTKDFLNQNTLEYITLEGSDIYLMPGGKLEDEHRMFFEKITNTDSYIEDRLDSLKGLKKWKKRVENKILKLSKPKDNSVGVIHLEPVSHIEELEKNARSVEALMWNLLGIGYWDEVVYLHYKQ